VGRLGNGAVDRDKEESMQSRRGVTLVECLIVIAILGALMAILVPAVQRVRQQAARAHDQNNLRQIGLALQNYASVRNGQLPGEKVRTIVPNAFAAGRAPLYNLLPFLEPESPAPYGERELTGANVGSGFRYRLVRIFLSPTDPSLAQFDPMRSRDGPTSYAVNQQAFDGSPNLHGTIPDGTSNTIAAAQHYFQTRREIGNFSGPSYLSYADWPLPVPAEPSSYLHTRSGTFADPAWLDAIPVTTGPPFSSKCSIAGMTFQVAPQLDKADSRFLQATQTSGLLVLMFDAHVTSFAPSVSETVFWAAVTPGGRETD
jgi:prepilin-type N-terminal cleavage/methylation domain-containing protein